MKRTFKISKKNPSPTEVLNLTFRNINEYISYRSTFQNELSAIWRFQSSLGGKDEPFIFSGFCEICKASVKYTAQTHSSASSQAGFHVKWSSVRCRCGLSARERRIASLISAREAAPLYHVGHFSALARSLAINYEKITTSQFKEGYTSGFIDSDGVRYEDLTKLSFLENTFKTIVCSEILEHIPDYRLALSEMRRCLKRGGSLIMTFPWLGGDHYNHRVRAELMDNGTVKHHLPPSYHGDPVNADGILSFRDFGWEILDELREIGFRDAYALFLYSPIHGYMTLSEPLIVANK